MSKDRPPANVTTRKVETVGWRELVDLPELELFGITAKIDTGARSSSLHVDKLTHYRDDQGNLRAAITLHMQGERRGKRKLDVPIKEFREVKSSNGAVEKRAVIRTRVKMGERSFLRDFTLTNRAGMRYPILVGRTGLRRVFLVNAAESFLLGRPSETQA